MSFIFSIISSESHTCRSTEGFSYSRTVQVRRYSAAIEFSARHDMSGLSASCTLPCIHLWREQMDPSASPQRSFAVTAEAQREQFSITAAAAQHTAAEPLAAFHASSLSIKVQHPTSILSVLSKTEDRLWDCGGGDRCDQRGGSHVW